jgi:hypothetical protein
MVGLAGTRAVVIVVAGVVPVVATVVVTVAVVVDEDAAEEEVANMKLQLREARDALVIAAGIVPDWLEGEGIRVLQLPTIFGPLSFQMSYKNKNVVVVHMEKGLRVPRGGIVIMAPRCRETVIHSLPCTLELSIESP